MKQQKVPVLTYWFFFEIFLISQRNRFFSESSWVIHSLKTRGVFALHRWWENTTSLFSQEMFIRHSLIILWGFNYIMKSGCIFFSRFFSCFFCFVTFIHSISELRVVFYFSIAGKKQLLRCLTNFPKIVSFFNFSKEKIRFKVIAAYTYRSLNVCELYILL